MVKLKIVWPCSSNNRSRSMPPPLRRSSSISTQANSNLARYFSIAFFIFAATTYLVFSLDMLMVPEEESITMMPRRQLEHEGVWLIPETAFPAANIVKSPNAGKLRTIPDAVAANEDVPVASDLVILAEEDMEALALEKQEAEEDMRIQQKASSTLFGKSREHNNKASFNSAHIDEEDDDFANGLNQIGLAMQQQQQLQQPYQQPQQQPPQVDASVPLPQSSALSSSINLADSDAGMGSDDMEDPPQPEEEEDEEEISVSLANSIPASPDKVPDASDAGPVVIPTSEWRRIHTCKYGRSEKSPTLAYGTWVWRHKKGAVLHDDYTKTPSDSKIRHLKAALKAIFTQEKVPDIRSVAGLASEAGYTLCKIDLEESIVVAWQPRLRGDALFFTRHAVSLATLPASVSNVVIEVPHALFDHTLHQGLHVFSETKAAALILSESHRCSRSLPNKCTGNEGEPIRNLCSSSSSKSYHNSDAAHAVQTTFHAVHEVLSEEHPESLVVSLHATKADEFVVSDGTSNPVAGSSPVFAFANQLAKNLGEHTIGLCNDHAHLHAPVSNLVPVSEDKRHVCGATNVQGRHLNGAADPCRAKVHRNGQELKASGRFLHVEQPVSVVVPIDSKSTKPVVSKPLSEAILVALNAVRQQFAALGSNRQ